MKKTDKIPQRMCVACRQMFPKHDLVRIVEQNGKGVVDTTGKMNGRGVYLCKNPDCLQKVCKNKGFKKTHNFCFDEELRAQTEKAIEQQN